jgi:hypothetical protein
MLLTITSQAPFLLVVERHHKCLEVIRGTQYTNHHAVEGDWLRLLIGKDLYVMKVVGGASCFADYGRTRITGARHK